MHPRNRIRSVSRYRKFALATLAPATLAIIMSGMASAQNAASGPDAGPPALVGRIAGLRGDVSLLRSGEQEWEQAGVNEPVSIGDAIYTQDNGGAKLEVGATDLRLRPDTEVEVATLDQQAGQLSLDTGIVELRVSALPTADGLFIATPRGTIRLTQPGIYRIDAGTQDQPTVVTAWNGAAQLGNSGAAITVQPNQTVLISGTADAPQYAYQPAGGDIPEAFRTPVRIVAAQQHFVSPDMTGAEDLYQYGSFQTVPGQGTVWYPSNVPADWQPYRYGHWEYVAPWGQTWIDDQPWGFAPFHYGRWARVGDRWGWYPGEYTPHPVYAPALVAFIGGGGLSASISFGGGDSIGWVPLGPGEDYRPPYRVGPTYIENINRTVIVNRTVVNNFGPDHERNVGEFANARFATVVPAAAVSGGRPVAQAAIRVQPQALEHVSANPKVVTELPRAAPNVVHQAARPGPVAPVAVTRGGPAPRPALPVAHGAQPGHPITGAKQEEAPRPGEPARPEAHTGPEMPQRGAPPVAGHPAPPPPTGRPEAIRPEAAKPEPARPEPPRPEAAKPQMPRPEAARPEPARPEPPRPEAARPQPPRPEAARPEPARPEPPRPEAARPQPPRPEAARPEPVRPEPPRPEAARPQPPRPEAARPEPPRPEAARPEPARPEPPRPEAARPQQAQAPHPEAKKPEPKKPGEDNK